MHIFCFRLARLSLSCNIAVFLLCGLLFLAFLTVFCFFKWLGFFGQSDSSSFVLSSHVSVGYLSDANVFWSAFLYNSVAKDRLFGKFQQEDPSTTLSATPSQV